MPSIEQLEAQLSEVVFSWRCPEDVKYKKNIWWYLISIVALVLIVWWAVADGNPLFAIFLVLFYFLTIIYEFREPQLVDVVITPDGVKLGSRFHYYKSFDHFYIVYKEKGVKNLYLEFKNFLRGRLIISIEGQNAVEIRQYLLNFLDEDLEREEEPLSERLRRWLRL
ncbi:MAG: hypothetical protein WC610_04260 [Patescibacteria group bacterium]